jgi:RHS repeat-associated protein
MTVMQKRGWMSSRRSRSATAATTAAAILCGMIAFAASTSVAAQTTTDIYHYEFGLYPSREQAEAAMRADSEYAGIGQYLEHVSTSRISVARAIFSYGVRDRPADSIAGPSFRADLGSMGSGIYGCTPLSSDPAYPGLCASEASLIPAAEQEIVKRWPGCTITGTTALAGYGTPQLQSNGAVGSSKQVITRATCGNGSARDHIWYVVRRSTLKCLSGFNPIGGPAPEETLTELNHCRPHNDDLAQIQGPLQQCSSCAASANPVYPATGEKARTEQDFAFAGRTFTRYYHSLRQFRPNSRFAVGWSHSYADSVSADGSTVDLVSEEGYYESFLQYQSGRFRGENSQDRIIERVNAGGIGWRLREPDGRLREYDTAGKLLHVRDPADPLNDVTVGRVNGLLATLTTANGRQLRFVYSANRLVRIDLPDGAQVTYSYDGAQNLTAVDYGGGAVRQYHYNETGLAGSAGQVHHLTGITAEGGQRFASFSYDTYGRVIESRVFGTPNEVTAVSYPAAGTASVATAAGGTDGYSYESGIYRRPLSSSNSAGSASNSYDSSGRVQEHIDRRGHVTQFEYQPAYRSALVEAVGLAQQRRTEFVRDAVNQRLTEQRVLDTAGGVKALQQWTYNSRGQLLTASETDPQTSVVRTTTKRYCEAADVSAGSCPLAGLLLSIDGPRAAPVLDVTSFSYRMADDPACAAAPATCNYRKGDIWKITNALGQDAELLRSDGAGRPLSLRDINGVVTDMEYNTRGWLAARKLRGADDGSEADDRITRIEYTPAGQVARIIEADGTSTSYAYDAAQRLTRITDNAGNYMAFTLDGAGQRIGEDTRDATGTLRRSLSRTFNALGQLQAQTDAYSNATTFSYDAAGNNTGQVDARSHIASQEFDPLDRLVQSVRDTAGLAQSAAVRYDLLDRPVEVTDPNGDPTSYAYDAFGGVLTRHSPDSGITQFTYDSAGNRSSQTDARGISASYSYDALNRLAVTSYADSSFNVTHSYDSNPACPAGENFVVGRLTRLVDRSGSTDYCYNRYGDLVRKVQQGNGRSFVLRWHYAANGQLTGMTYPSGIELDYVYDSQGRVREIGVLREGVPRQRLIYDATYHPFGPVAQWRYANGRLMQRSVDLNYRPLLIGDGAAGGIAYGYEYDANGNLSRVGNGNPATAPLRSYVYDGVDRLLSARDAGDVVQHSYSYDPNGNRLGEGHWVTYASSSGPPGDPGGTTTTQVFETTAYGYSGNRLTAVGAEERSYDAAGNLATIGAPPATGPGLPAGPRWSYNYDAAGRLYSAIKGAYFAQYFYNGLGEQVRRSFNGSTYFIYGENGQWLAEHGDSGQAQQEIIWLGNLPVGVVKPDGGLGQLYYVQPDALGTPRAVIDPTRGAQGIAVWRWNLAGDAFGADTPEQDADGDNTPFVFDLRFPGQRYDATSGLNYNYFRDYEAATGRYVQSDPIGLAGGSNTYTYAKENPLVISDVYGLKGGGAAARSSTRNSSRNGPAGLAPGLQPLRPVARPSNYFRRLTREAEFWEQLSEALDNEWWPANRYKDLKGERVCEVEYCDNFDPNPKCFAPWARVAQVSSPDYRPVYCRCVKWRDE